MITYRTESDWRVLITHRIVRIEDDPKGRVFQTKGDANQDTDPLLVLADRLYGRVVFSLPLVGFVTFYVANTVGGKAVVVVLALGLWYVHSVRRSTRPNTSLSGRPGHDSTGTPAIPAEPSVATPLSPTTSFPHEAVSLPQSPVRSPAVPSPKLAPKIDALLLFAEGAARAGYANKAYAHFRQATELDPGITAAWVGRARFAPAPDERITCLETALRLDPGEPEILKSLRRARLEATEARS